MDSASYGGMSRLGGGRGFYYHVDQVGGVLWRDKAVMVRTVFDRNEWWEFWQHG